MKINDKIPESLKKQFAGYENSLFRTESLLTICAAISALVLSFLVAFGSDRIWDTLPHIRFIIVLLGVMPLLYLFFKWGQHWIWRKRTVKDLAAGIQSHHKLLGDRLLGAIELSEGEHNDENISEELLDAAIKKIAQQSSEIDFKKDVDKKKPSTALLAALLLFSLGGIIYYLIPDAFNNAFARWANPLSSISRFTFTVLGELPKEKFVPASEPFPMTFEIDPNSHWKPKTFSYSLEGSSKGTEELRNGKAELELPGIAQTSTLDISVGDATGSTSIKPVNRPSLKKLFAEIEFPQYLNKKSQNIKIENGSFSLLAGSFFKLKGIVSRELRRATLAYEKKPETEISVKSVNFSTEKMPVTKAQKLVLNWEDIHQINPAVPYDLNLKVKEDSEPFVECADLAPFSAILIDESLNIEIRAEDDYGIKMIDAEYEIESIDGKKNKNKTTETINLSAGAPDKKKLGTGFIFSPSLMNLPEKALIAIKGVAKDYYPGRKLSKSNIYRIYILSYDQHARLVQDRLEKIMAEIEDLIRREKESLNKNSKISKFDDKKIADKKTTDKITDQKLREQRERRDTEKMVSEAMKLLKEALRNKKFPDKTLAEWSKFMEQMKNISQQDMKDVVSNLQKAQSTKERRKNMEETAKTQREMIKKMQEMLDEMDDSLKKLSVENFVNRLKKEAGKESKISANLKIMMKDIVGLSPDKMPENLKDKFLNQIKIQKSVGLNAKEIRDELRAFFSRTRIEKYKNVVDDMEKEKMDSGLEKLQQSLAENHSGASMNNSKKMADNFNKWAKMLGNGDDKKSGGGGQGGQQAEVDMELLLGMLRMIQGEQNIRDKTRSLEKNKPQQKEYKEQADRIADEQDDLYRMLREVQNKIEDCPQAVDLLEEAGQAMQEAEEMLKKPQTDVNTIAAETEVIERLSGAFQQSSKKGGKGKPGAQMMAMLMQMLMQQQGQGKPGSKPGQGSGGFSDDPNKRFTGPDFHKNDPDRTIDGTTGSETVKLPEEYKSSIEAFYKKVNE